MTDWEELPISKPPKKTDGLICKFRKALDINTSVNPLSRSQSILSLQRRGNCISDTPRQLVASMTHSFHWAW